MKPNQEPGDGTGGPAGMVSRDDTATVTSDPLLSRVAEKVRDACLDGAERVAVFKAVDKARHRARHGTSGLDASRAVLIAADDRSTPYRARAVLKEVAPLLVDGQVTR